MFDFLTAINKQLFVLMLKNKIIGITNIPLDSQFVLNELIQFVQVYIREQLRCQITERQSRVKTIDYFSKKIHEPLVTSSF